MLIISSLKMQYIFFFFNDTATTEIYTLSLHDALPICEVDRAHSYGCEAKAAHRCRCEVDRKSTRLNSSHSSISYAVFCLKKKKKITAGATEPMLNTYCLIWITFKHSLCCRAMLLMS